MRCLCVTFFMRRALGEAPVCEVTRLPLDTRHPAEGISMLLFAIPASLPMRRPMNDDLLSPAEAGGRLHTQVSPVLMPCAQSSATQSISTSNGRGSRRHVQENVRRRVLGAELI